MTSLASKSPLVKFAIGGAQKCGTTSAFQYLRNHPAVQLPPEKEAHFFDNEGLDWPRDDYSAYENLFIRDERLCGDATPIYIYWPQSLERIRSYNPGMRLIFLFRCPIARAWSHWRMEHASGRETQPFAWAIREGRRRVDDPHAPGHHRVFSYVERGFYGVQLKKCLELFPREQVLILRSQDLRTQPRETLNSVCEFLRVPPILNITPHVYHASPAEDPPHSITLDDIRLLENLFRADLELFSRLSGVSLQREPIPSEYQHCQL